MEGEQLVGSKLLSRGIQEVVNGCLATSLLWSRASLWSCGGLFARFFPRCWRFTTNGSLAPPVVLWMDVLD